MKKLFTFLLFSLSVSFVNAQCNATQNASLVISTAYSVNATSDPTVIKVCSGGIAYDTVSGLNRTWYLEAGGTLYLKSNPTTLVYMKSGSTLINKGSASAIIAYNEAGATISDQGNPPVNSVTCTSVSFPATLSCTTTGLVENRSENVLHVYPNPADSKITLASQSEYSNWELYDVLGKKIFSGSTAVIESSRIIEGVYILKVMFTNGTSGSKRIVVQH